MDPVYATAAYCRATLITPHDYLRTVGNLKTVEGSTVAGISNQGRQSGLRRSRESKCREARSVTLAHLPRSRWTHKHRRFANLSVVHRNSSSTSRIILIYITGSSSSTSRRHRRSSSTSRLSRGAFNIATIPSTSENQRASRHQGTCSWRALFPAQNIRIADGSKLTNKAPICGGNIPGSILHYLSISKLTNIGCSAQPEAHQTNNSTT